MCSVNDAISHWRVRGGVVILFVFLKDQLISSVEDRLKRGKTNLEDKVEGNSNYPLKLQHG